MDWKRLVQFALLGSSDLEQYAILLVRVSIGVFFAISGANKLFVAGGTKPVYETLVKTKVPFPHQTAYFVSGVEFVGGSLLAVGFLSSPACVALLIDMIVATLTSALSTMPKGLSPLNWLDDFLYLPEVLYVLFLYLAALLWSGKVQSRLLARRQVREVIDLPRLLSVNVGLPRDVTWNGKTVRTSVWKSPVDGRRMVRKLDIDGDAQADLAGHGGEHRAIFVYQMDSYHYWESFLGRNDFTFGQFGSITYNPDPLERPAPGNVLVCCSQPNADVTLDL